MTVASDRAAAFASVRRLVGLLAARYRRAYGGDFEEAWAQACLHACEALDTYDPARGALTTWVYHRVWGKLREAGRRARAREGLYNRRYEVRERETPGRARFDLKKVLGELSPDGRRALGAALRAPSNNPRHRRRAVVRFLAELGWASGRILEAFAEVKGVLLG
jgi:hypothetical protein